MKDYDIERIAEMEELYACLIKEVSEIMHEIDRGELSLLQIEEKRDALQEQIDILADYYESEEWLADFEADEAGLLPEGMSRGVLSEDGVYNLLEQYAETGYNE